MVGWVQKIDEIRAHIARRPIMFAFAAMLVAGAVIVTTTSPISARNETLTAQMESRQTLYNQLMANANYLDQAAIDLRRMSIRGSLLPRPARPDSRLQVGGVGQPQRRPGDAGAGG